MNLVPLKMLNSPQSMLSLISQRQEALGDNIANMHTVGYRRKDVDFSQYLNNGISSNLETKTIEKFGTTPISSSSSNKQIPVEDELALMQKNYLMYNVAVRQLSSTITEIKTALNVSSNG